MSGDQSIHQDRSDGSTVFEKFTFKTILSIKGDFHFSRTVSFTVAVITNHKIIIWRVAIPGLHFNYALFR